MTSMDDFFVGFDRAAKAIQDANKQLTNKSFTYPPFNIKKVNDNKYVIELAVAGFGESDINIEMEGNTLRIEGNSKATSEASEYLYKGIAERPFARNFAVADNIEVKNAELINGMLRIWLESQLPQKKSRKIDINKGEGPGEHKSYLTE